MYFTSASKITELCEEFSSEKQIIEAVNFNSLEQTVVAGHLDLIEASVEKFKKAGAKLVKIIPVSIAAHTSLLKNCKDKLSRLLKNISFSCKFNIICTCFIILFCTI